MTIIAIAIVGRAITIEKSMEKRSHESCTKQILELAKEIKSDNFCYYKVGRAITNELSVGNTKFILHFRGYL